MNLYNESPDLYRTINTDGIIVACNKSYAKSLGYSKKEVIGKSIFEHVAEESLLELRESFDTWKEKGTVCNMEISLRGKDGSAFPVLLSAINLYDENENLVGSNTVIRDITKFKKQLEGKDALIRMQFQEIKELDKAKDEFASMITRELKTPLVPIKSYVDMLLSGRFGALNEEQRERLEEVKLSTNSLLRIVSDFSYVMKIELGQLELSKEVHDLSEIIDDVVTNMKPAAEKRNISITADLQENILCSCNKTAIEQVLTNLVVNAVNYSKENGKIHIKLGSENSYAKVVVKDNGVGIKRDMLDKIFVKLYQINTSLVREGGGIGLGLSVCKGIIEGHDGKIWAESKGLGQGTEIHIILPLEK